MLNLGPGSTCDVCLEHYGQDSKCPCSIQCGHVFCLACLQHLPRPQCPMCRTPYDADSIVRLHIDVDNSQRGSPTNPPTGATQAEQDARRLQDALQAIFSTGSSEEKLRALIDECRNFLADYPRSMFPDLRMTHRVIAYLCEVKSTLNHQRHACTALQGQVEQLGAEKGELEKRVQELKERRRHERQTALTVEKGLRDHCSRAHKAYETVVDQYNFIVEEWRRLQLEIRFLGMPPTPQPIPPTPDMDMDPDLAKTPQPRPFAELDQSGLKEAAVHDPTTYLISPLPQFTGPLPDPVALPEEDEARDKFKAKKSLRKKASQISFQSFVIPPSPLPKKCDAAGHPYTCDCEEFAIFNEDNKKRGSRRPSIANSASTPVIEANMNAPPPTPSGTSYPTPMMSPGRARSHTIPMHNSRPPSRVPSRTSSPKPRPSGGVRDVYSPTSSHSSLQSRETESLKSRLHDLLQDNTGTSSSLPNMTSTHFPASLARGTPQQVQKAELAPRPPSRDATAPLQHRVTPLMSPKQGEGERVRASPPSGTTYVAPSTPSGPSVPQAPVFSRASNAAMAIEKERKEKKEQERERRRLEKEKKQSELARSGSVSSSASSSYHKLRASSGPDSTVPYASQRHTSAGATHNSSSMMSPTALGIYT